jgi:hypothetical protein
LNPPERQLERAYPYFNGKTAQRFIEHATELIVEVCGHLKEQVPAGNSGLEWLRPDKLEPYQSPLGDRQWLLLMSSPTTLALPVQSVPSPRASQIRADQHGIEQSLEREQCITVCNS